MAILNKVNVREVLVNGTTVHVSKFEFEYRTEVNDNGKLVVRYASVTLPGVISSPADAVAALEKMGNKRIIPNLPKTTGSKNGIQYRVTLKSDYSATELAVVLADLFKLVKVNIAANSSAVPTDKSTKDEIAAYLTSKGVEFEPAAKKSDLLALIA